MTERKTANNCLITAIAEAAGLKIPDNNRLLIEIRNEINSNIDGNYAPFEMLDFDAPVVQTILNRLGLIGHPVVVVERRAFYNGNIHVASTPEYIQAENHPNPIKIYYKSLHFKAQSFE